MPRSNLVTTLVFEQPKIEEHPSTGQNEELSARSLSPIDSAPASGVRPDAGTWPQGGAGIWLAETRSEELLGQPLEAGESSEDKVGLERGFA